MAWYHLATLQIRSKNSAGVVQHTYAPMLYSNGVPITFTMQGDGITVSNDMSNAVIEQIELGNYDRADVVRGIYQSIGISMNVIGGVWLCATGGGYSNLEVVMSDRYVLGNVLELSLDSGTTWKQVRLDQDVTSKLESKNIGLHRDMVFMTTSLQTAEVAASSGGI